MSVHPGLLRPCPNGCSEQVVLLKDGRTVEADGLLHTYRCRNRNAPPAPASPGAETPAIPQPPADTPQAYPASSPAAVSLEDGGDEDASRPLVPTPCHDCGEMDCRCEGSRRWLEERVSALEADAERMTAALDDTLAQAEGAERAWSDAMRRLKWAQIDGNHLGWGFDEDPVRYYVAAYTTSANGYTEEQVAKVYHDGTPASVAAAEAQAIDDAIAAARSAQQEGRDR